METSEASIKKSHKRHRSKDRDSGKSSKKRHHKDDDGARKHKHKHKSKHEGSEDEDMWIEKNIDLNPDRPLATTIPTAESLKITSSAVAPSQKRDDWMMAPAIFSADAPNASSSKTQLISGNESLTEDYGEAATDTRTASGGVDFFSTLGSEVKKKPSKNDPDQPKSVHHKELNTNMYYAQDGTATVIDPNAPTSTPSKTVPGGPGSQWRMTRLKRVYEAAEEEGRPIEQVALDRFETIELFQEAVEERRILDERDGGSRRGREIDRRTPAKGFMFSDSTGSSRSSSFRRPGMEDSRPSTPANKQLPPSSRRFDSLRLPSQAASPLAQQSFTPIPSVMTPSTSKRGLSPSALNRLQAKVLRAKLMGAPDAENLEKEYEEESKRATGVHSNEQGKRVEVLPTLDGKGRLYDVGTGKDDESDLAPGNRKKKEKHFDTHDSTGNLVRYNASDDTTTLGELLRQEKFGGGMDDQKDLDAEFARAIAGDGKFQNNLDYIDENASKLGRQKVRSDVMKRQFAVQDYAKTQKALSTCSFCTPDESLPQAPIIAMGTRVYLSCTITEELVPGHCLIVPREHMLCMLEGDDDVWEETKNFMKTLIRTFAEKDQGVVFYETVISHKWIKHTYIECVPLPWAAFEDIPGYFKESILSSESEWSQHRKLIDFSSRPGGFRRSMVPNLPYFMVMFDHRGEKGWGHVIEGSDSATTGEEEREGLEEGGKFPKYFAPEIIGNVLEIDDARRWRRPRRVEVGRNKQRIKDFRDGFPGYASFDWTGMIGQE